MTIPKVCAILMLAAAALATVANESASSQKADVASLPNRVWQDPGDMESLDLFYGPGGSAHAPDPDGTFTFVQEDMNATSPKFDVTDEKGVTWKVKVGEEAQSETAATRLLWAAGYFVDEDYYEAELTVTGLPKLKRGKEFVFPGSVVHGARLERKLPGVKKLENWDWYVNPFVGQREMNGLRVMMAFVNNWDLKAVNNTIYAVDGERHYVVTDLGATFGNTGNSLNRSKSEPARFEDSRFVEKTRTDSVDFVLHSRPFSLSVLNATNYRERTKMESIPKHIPRADARWLGQRLSLLTDEQIRDAFRAGGYGTVEVEGLTHTIRQRISTLEAL